MTSYRIANCSRVAAIVVAAAIALSVCSGKNSTQQRVLSGGAIGAGTVIDRVTGGNPVAGAILGGAAGAAGGCIYD